MNRKQCSSCNNWLPADKTNFVTHLECKDGISGTCKECRNKYSRDWKQKNRATLNTIRRVRYAAENGAHHKKLERQRIERNPYTVTAENMIQGVKSRSIKRGLPFSPSIIDKGFVTTWLKNQPNCDCCGIELKIGRRTDRNTGPQKNSPTFDQIIPGDGYTLDNVALICWQCNNIKRNYRASDLRIVARWMEDIERRALEGTTEPQSQPLVRDSDVVATSIAEAA